MPSPLVVYLCLVVCLLALASCLEPCHAYHEILCCDLTVINLDTVYMKLSLMAAAGT